MVVPILFRHLAATGYSKYRHDFAKLIWKNASPKWDFDDATFDRTAVAFENPDHVAIIIHNYRWRLDLAGEARYDDLEKRLAASPVITIPTITLEGGPNGAPRRIPAPTPASSPAGTSIAWSRAEWDTIFRKRRRRRLLRLSWTASQFDRDPYPPLLA